MFPVVFLTCHTVASVSVFTGRCEVLFGVTHGAAAAAADNTTTSDSWCCYYVRKCSKDGSEGEERQEVA